MKCAHCLVDFHDEWSEDMMGWRGHPLFDDDGFYRVNTTKCRACARAIIVLRRTDISGQQVIGDSLIWPLAMARAVLGAEVPRPLAADYREACDVLPISARASAALSRRCLQHLLREHEGVKRSDLAKEIQEVIDRKTLPSHLSTAIDAIRAVGNFAAHPIKSTNTGEIVDVEPGEAELVLDVLEGLFDFYFVQPALFAVKRGELNRKLADAGKPPLKG